MEAHMPELNELAPVMRPMGAFLSLTLILIAAEFFYARLSHHDEHHDVREMTASVGVALGNFAVRAIEGGLAALPFMLLYDYRLFDIPMTTLWAWGALFLGTEFAYYWFHRASHRVRWLWATHAVHHSATHFNLSAAIRLGWTGQLTGAFVFFLPLAWIGFSPVAIGAMLSAGLLYQFFLHTALPVHFGPLESILNTPAHHRVHHSCNEACLDKNYGSVLIVFDRLFGTFAAPPQGERLRFGLEGRAPSNNPLVIALGEWRHLAHDAARAKGARAKLKVLFGAP
jgi:sterol desaturase/sphingolipid hydroxylase (fatty acid hydroxylase superfamily)